MLKLADLSYAYSALEPHIDARTMEIHHSKHHKAYVDKANAALEGGPLAGLDDAWQVCARLGDAPADKLGALRNNAGGVANHDLFWKTMAPTSAGGGVSPSGALASEIDRAFGSFDAFKQRFADAAVNRFGSGWAWLYVNPAGELAIGSTANQDNPVMGEKFAGIVGTPILGLDVWEHAYYLNYQNRRPDYVAAWWHVVHWTAVGELFAKATAAKA